MAATMKIPEHNTPRGAWCRASGCDSTTGVCHLCKPVIDGLSDREAAALVALAQAGYAVMGLGLARQMRSLGRATSVAAAHQAGAALARKGLAIKATPVNSDYVRYEINNQGRALALTDERLAAEAAFEASQDRHAGQIVEDVLQAAKDECPEAGR
jgi:hypothetical protein